MISRIFDNETRITSKRYIALQQHTLMDKIMMVVLGFLVVGIPIAFMQPDTGELRDQPLYLLFYASIGGIIVVIMYNGYKGKKARQQAN